MPLAVTSPTPRVNASGTSATSGQFSPPAGSVLVVVSHANSNTTGSVTCAVSNTVSALTWTQAVFANYATVTQPSGTFIHVAVCPTALTNITVTATTTNNNTGAGDAYTSIRPWLVTGADTSDPIGGSNRGGSTTNNLTTTGFTTERANSIGFCGGTDWNAAGAPISSDMGANGDAFASVDVLVGYGGWKALGAAGTSATFNLDASGTAASAWTWAAVEILAAPEATGGRRLFLPF